MIRRTPTLVSLFALLILGIPAVPALADGAAPQAAKTPAKTSGKAAATDVKDDSAHQVDAAFATGGVATKDTHKPWSVIVANSIGFGLQTDAATAYYYGELSATGSWRFTRNISLWLNTGLYYTPDPRPNDGRSLDAGGVSLTLRDSRIYQDHRFTGLVLSGALQVAVPLSMKAFNSLHYPYPSVGVGLALSRKIGEVAVRYSVSFNKFNPADTVYISRICATNQPVDTCLGTYQHDWQLAQGLSALWSPVGHVVVSGTFQFVTARTFGPATHLAGTGPGEITGLPANASDGFAFELSATWDTPVDGLSAGLSFSNGGPWRSNGDAIYNPLFDPRLAAMSVDVSYTF